MEPKRLEQLEDFLRSLPDEIFQVVGKYMEPGDYCQARLVSKRFAELLHVVPAKLNITPAYLAAPVPVTADPNTAGSIEVAGRTLRAHRHHIVPTPADRRQPPIVLQPPWDVTRVPAVFPGAQQAVVRILSRPGVRGEGITAKPERVAGLLTSLSALTCCKQHDLDSRATQAYFGNTSKASQSAAALTGVRNQGVNSRSLVSSPLKSTADHSRPHAFASTSVSNDGNDLPTLGNGNAGSSHQQLQQVQGNEPAAQPFNAAHAASTSTHSIPESGLRLSLLLDIDVPRPRHKDAYASAKDLAETAINSTARIGTGLHTLRLGWYIPNLANMLPLAACFDALKNLRRLELPMIPGSVLASLSVLTSLTALRVKGVGDAMHMADLGVDRHTEVVSLSNLTNLKELHLDGWVSETALVDVLLGLKGLREFKLGEDLALVARDLPLPLLTQLTSVSCPAPVLPQVIGHEQPLGSTGTFTPNSRNSHLDVTHLPLLKRFKGPPPFGKLTSVGPGLTSTADGGMVPNNNMGTVASSSQPAGLPSRLAGPGTGAARRQAKVPVIITPELSNLEVDLGMTTYGVPCPDLYLGLLPCLTRLCMNIMVFSQEDLQILEPAMTAIQGGYLPVLQELVINMVRHQPFSALASPVVFKPLTNAAALGHLKRLKRFTSSHFWDGLAPEGWDYTTKGALGAIPGSRLTPSNLKPKQHLSWLTGLPNLTTLHLHTDRCRLSLLPSTLTSLELEGLVQLDDGMITPGDVIVPRQQTPGCQCPNLKILNVLMAKHPRTVAPPGTSVDRGSADGYSSLGNMNPDQPPTLATKLQRGSFCILDSLLPVLSPTLTSLSISATPSPSITRLDQLRPDDYGLHAISQLPNLINLQLYVMPKHQWLIDCRQLQGLSSLSRLRTLNLESPVTGATRLVCLTALSSLTQLTQLVTGRFDDEAYQGRIMVGGMTPAARCVAFSWLSGLVAGRFGNLPVPPPPPGSTPSLSAALDDDSGSDNESEVVEGEEGAGALLGSDVDVFSDDLLFESGNEGDDLASSDALVYEADEEVDD